MYYTIEVINDLNIDFIVIIATRMQSPNRNSVGILVFSGDPYLHFLPGCSEQAQNLFKYPHQ